MNGNRLLKTIFISEKYDNSFFNPKFSDPEMEQRYIQYNSSMFVKVKILVSLVSLLYTALNIYFTYKKVLNAAFLIFGIASLTLFSVLNFLLFVVVKKLIHKQALSYLLVCASLMYSIISIGVLGYYTNRKEGTLCIILIRTAEEQQSCNSQTCANFIESTLRNFYIQSFIIIFKYFTFLKQSKLVSISLCLIYLSLFLWIDIYINLGIEFYISEILFLFLGILVFAFFSDNINNYFRENFINTQRIIILFEYYKNFIDECDFQYVSICDDEVLIHNRSFSSNSLSLSKDRESIISNNDTIEFKQTINTQDVYGNLDSLYQNDCSLKHYLTCFLESINDDKAEINRQEQFVRIGVFHSKDQKKHYIVSYRVFKIKNLKTIFDLIIHDITQLKAAEARETETKLKERLFSKIAHEFKTPLLTIIGMVGQLRDDLEVRNYSSVETSAVHISCMSEFVLFQINDIIYYSDQETIKINMEYVNLMSILEFCGVVIQTLLQVGTGNKNNIKFFLNIEEKIKEYNVMTDKNRIKQVLLNFASNAIKFTSTGSITLSARLENDMTSVFISLTDTGVGISTNDIIDIETNNLEKLSISSHSEVNQMGTGLGIGIAKTMIRKMNHKFVVESKPGQGSMFGVLINDIVQNFNSFKNESNSNDDATVMLDKWSGPNLIMVSKGSQSSFNKSLESERALPKPASINIISEISKRDPVASILKNKSTNSLADRIKTCKLLVVDDNKIIRRATTNLLSKDPELGSLFKIEECTDGVDCLYQTINNQLEGNKIKMIITDQSMEFMNGNECVKIIRGFEANKKIVPIFLIILTAFNDPETLNTLLHDGANLIIQKPLSSEDLKTILFEFNNWNQ